MEKQIDFSWWEACSYGTWGGLLPPDRTVGWVRRDGRLS